MPRLAQCNNILLKQKLLQQTVHVALCYLWITVLQKLKQNVCRYLDVFCNNALRRSKLKLRQINSTHGHKNRFIIMNIAGSLRWLRHSSPLVVRLNRKSSLLLTVSF